MTSIRTLFGTALLASCVASTAAAFASDYSVSFALDVDHVSDWGRVACEYATPCKIVSRRTKLSVSLAFQEPNHRNVFIRATRAEDGVDCCYFSAGADEIARDVEVSPVRVHVYAKRGATRDFFLNQPFGVLYFQFLDMR